MANNTTLNAGSGGDTIRDLDRAGVKTSVVALDLNPAGVETLMAGAMPVTGTFWQATQPVSGTVTANAGTNLNTSALALESGGHLASLDTKAPALGQALAAASVPVVLTAAQLTALTPLSTVGVTGTFWQATQPVSAAALPLPSGASTAAKQPALGTAGVASADVLTVQGVASMTALKVDGSAVTQPVSIASSVTVAQATASSLNATVVGTGTFAVQASQAGTWSTRSQDGTGNALTSRTTGTSRPLEVAILDSSGNQITAFGGSGGTASNFGSAVPASGTAAGFSDGTNMQSARAFDLDSGVGTQYVLGVGLRLSAGGGSVEAGTSSNPIRTDPTGTTAQPVSGTVTANAGTNLNTSALALDATLTGGTQKTKLVDTAGTNVATVSAAGALKVDGSAVTQPVSGTFWQATQPVSAASLPLPSGASTAAKQPALGTAGTASTDVLTVQGIASMTALKVDGSAVTQPVSGTVGVSGTVTVDSELTTADLDTGAGTDTRAVVGLALAESGGALLVGSAHPLPVSGTFWQATQPVSAASLPLPSGASTAAKQPALGTAGVASADVLTVQGVASMTALKVDGSAVTQPVSGTVTANAGTNLNTSALALDATLTGGTQKTKLVDTAGTNVATVSAGGALKVDASATTQPVSGTVAATQSGTWNVSTVTTVSAVTAITNALPAGTNLLGQVSGSGETSTLYNGTTALTPKFATIAASTLGPTTIVAAVASKKIRVLRWSLTANGIVNAKWQSHVTPTDLTGLHYLTQYASAGGSYCPVGIFQTVAGEALDLNLSAAVAVGGVLTYVEV